MSTVESPDLFPPVAQFISERRSEFGQIAPGRKDSLEAVAKYVSARLHADKPARLTFICTHNSRRSQFSQVWAQIAADIFNLNVETFSGGTETTAFNPRAVASLRRVGLKIDVDDPQAENPVYRVSHAVSGPTQTCFSKVYKDSPNPTSEYCAVMTCSHADQACPMVIGCDQRIAVMYDDPKAADDTPEEAATYDERSRQISREMLYMMSKVSV